MGVEPQGEWPVAVQGVASRVGEEVGQWHAEGEGLPPQTKQEEMQSQEEEFYLEGAESQEGVELT